MTKAKIKVACKLLGALQDGATRKPINNTQNFYPFELKAWFRP